MLVLEQTNLNKILRSSFFYQRENLMSKRYSNILTEE